MKLRLFHRLPGTCFELPTNKFLDMTLTQAVALSDSLENRSLIVRLPDLGKNAQLPCLPPMLMGQVKLVIMTPAPPLLATINDLLPWAANIAKHVPGPLGKVNSQMKPIPEHVTGYAFNLLAGCVQETAEIIETFPPVRLSVDARFRRLARNGTRKNTKNSLTKTFDLDGLIYREALAEATDHIYFPGTDGFGDETYGDAYDEVSVQSAWAQQSISGASETFVSVDSMETTGQIVESMFDAGREFRETIVEREREEFEEWKKNNRQHMDSGGSAIVSARRLLNLCDSGAEDKKVKVAFNQAAKAAHPDFGGSVGEFIELRKAYIKVVDFNNGRNI